MAGTQQQCLKHAKMTPLRHEFDYITLKMHTTTHCITAMAILHPYEPPNQLNWLIRRELIITRGSDS